MLNQRLKSLRLAKGLTLQQVGDVFGVSKASVSSWENEKSLPDHKKLERLAELFGTTVQYLVTGDDGEKLLNSGLQKIPFIEWRQIGKQKNQESTKKIIPLHTSPGVNSFATRYPASSEFDWQVTYIPAGSILIIDPDIKPGPLDTVLIKINEDLCLAKFTMTPENKKVLIKLDAAPFIQTATNIDEIVGVVLEWQISSKLK